MFMSANMYARLANLMQKNRTDQFHSVQTKKTNYNKANYCLGGAFNKTKKEEE